MHDISELAKVKYLLQTHMKSNVIFDWRAPLLPRETATGPYPPPKHTCRYLCFERSGKVLISTSNYGVTFYPFFSNYLFI